MRSLGGGRIVSCKVSADLFTDSVCRPDLGLCSYYTVPLASLGFGLNLYYLEAVVAPVAVVSVGTLWCHQPVKDKTQNNAILNCMQRPSHDRCHKPKGRPNKRPGLFAMTKIISISMRARPLTCRWSKRGIVAFATARQSRNLPTRPTMLTRRQLE